MSAQAINETPTQKVPPKEVVIHGAYLEMFGLGVMLCGKAAVGKSELALEMISRKHRFIADDAPLFKLTNNNKLVGYCPKNLQGFLEVRGLGIINIEKLFGKDTLLASCELNLIVNLDKMDAKAMQSIDRICGTYQTQKVLGVAIDSVSLPVGMGHALPNLVEVAAKHIQLKQQGYEAHKDFLKKNAKLMELG